MAQIFPASANTLARLALALLPAGAVAAVGLTYALARSDYATGVGAAPAQPVPFSHQHHVGGLGMDCRYCHATVENSSFADLPPAQTCMSCHSEVWRDAAVLEPLRESFRSGRPLAWTRVNDLPDYVYFDHSIHLAKGVGCVSCHGRVDAMPLTVKAHSLYMKWCLDCHNDPAPNLRPRELVFDMDMEWTARRGVAREAGSATTGAGPTPSGYPKPDADPAALGRELMRRYHVRTAGLTDCVTCHR
jgi:hypothetical protein